VSLLPFLVVSLGAAGACLVSRRWPLLEISIGLGSLLLATIAALAITPGDQLKLGSGEVLLATAYGRLFLTLGSALGLLLCLVGLATTWPANLPAGVLVGLGGTALALSAGDPLVAVLVLVATSMGSSLGDPQRHAYG
jgi:hypothetical protein